MWRLGLINDREFGPRLGGRLAGKSDCLAIAIKQTPPARIWIQMQALPSCDLQIRISADLNQMIAFRQFAGQQLFIAQHLAVAHERWKIAVRGWSQTPAFRSQAGREVLILKRRKHIGKGAFDGQAMVSQE